MTFPNAWAPLMAPIRGNSERQLSIGSIGGAMPSRAVRLVACASRLTRRVPLPLTASNACSGDCIDEELVEIDACNAGLNIFCCYYATKKYYILLYFSFILLYFSSMNINLRGKNEIKYFSRMTLIFRHCEN